jgi:excisionase family DNA binding protein
MLTLNKSMLPNSRDVLLAQESHRQIGGMSFGRKESVRMQIEGKMVAIPIAAARILLDALSRMADGKSMAVIGLDDEVSPQEAAELLNVSRPFAAKLFDEGAFPSRKVGTHRRALASDVLAYKEKEKQARLKALDALAEESQRLNLGY